MIGNDYKVNNKQGISLILCGIAMLSFIYISFLGLGYFLEGYFDSLDFTQILPTFMAEVDSLLLLYVLITVVYVILLVVFMYFICSSKSKRNKNVGLPIEIISGFIIVIMLLAGSVPFMKFLYIFEQEKTLLEEVEQMRKSALDVDDDYVEYVNSRINNYHDRCVYYHGEDSKQVEMSLYRRLIPLNYDKIKEAREAWLEQMASVSIWNPCTAHNVKAVLRASEDWTKEYKKLSSLSYQYEIDYLGTKVSPFEHINSKSNRDKWIEKFKEIEIPDLRALGAMAIVLVLFFSLYISIDRPRNIITGTHRNS